MTAEEAVATPPNCFLPSRPSAAAAIKRRTKLLFLPPPMAAKPTETDELNDDDCDAEDSGVGVGVGGGRKPTLRVFCGPVGIGTNRLTREGSYDPRPPARHRPRVAFYLALSVISEGAPLSN